MHAMKRRTIVLLALLLTFLLLMAPVSSPALAAPNPANPVELESFVDGIMAAEMEMNYIPGAVVTVVKDGDILLNKGYGYADLERGIPVDVDRTLFRPGSVSKLVVWTAVMQQVEQGVLSLDSDINDYLDFTIPDTFPEPITLAHLMAHTAGFEDENRQSFRLNAEEMRSLEDYLRDNLPVRVYAPGEVGAYSNYGASLAGYIVERVSDLSFDEYARQYIFAPLGMEGSTFVQPLPDSLSDDMSGGYNFGGGQYYEGGFEYILDYPAGGLSAPATDMAAFMIAHLQNGRYGATHILQEATAERMHSRHYSADPRLDGMAHGFFESTINGRRVISHGGDTFLFHSGLYLLPDENVGLYVSTNGVGGAGVSDRLLGLFVDRYYPGVSQPATQPPADFADRIAPYLGSYYLSRSNHTGLEKVLGLMTPISLGLNDDGFAVLSLAGQVTQYVETEPGLLQDRYNPDSRLAYRMDEDGQAIIFSPMPFNFVKLPWYGTLSLHYLVLGLGVGLFLSTLIGWSVGFVRARRRHEPQPRLGRWARLTAALFGLLFIVFLLAFVTLFSSIDPAYGVPSVFFGLPPAFNWLLIVPVVLLVLAAVMVVLAALLWRNRVWGIGGRVHYSLLAVLAVALVMSLGYWNLLL